MSLTSNKESLVPSNEIPLFKVLLAEFIGTFILVFLGASAAAIALQDNGVYLNIGLAFGLTLIFLIYILGAYSGANFNPAVSFGLFLTGRMNGVTMLLYWLVQIIAGIAAAALVMYFFGNPGATVGVATNTDPFKAILAEALATFVLVLALLFITRVVLYKSVAAILIGFALTFGIIAIGYLTGGSLNPARSFGPAIFSGNLPTIYIYIIGPLLGAAVAALVYWLYFNDWNCCYVVDDCGNRVLDECGNPIKECTYPVADECINKHDKLAQCSKDL